MRTTYEVIWKNFTRAVTSCVTSISGPAFFNLAANMPSMYAKHRDGYVVCMYVCIYICKGIVGNVNILAYGHDTRGYMRNFL